MNNEQQELLNEAYEKYYATLIDSITFSERGKHFKSNGLEFNSGYPNYVHYSKEEFINKCKTDPEFSEKWGLKIEERELSEGERGLLLQPLGLDPLTKEGRDRLWKENNLPTKLITIKYNDKTIESYV
jgi:hypothetical protein